MISEDFEYILSKYGRPSDPIFLTEDQLSSYRGVLPSSLLELWKEVGLGGWGNGIFQFCQPNDYSSIIEGVFQGDPQIKSTDCAVYGYEAFCQLHIWHKTLGSMLVDLVFGEVEADFVNGEKRAEIDRRLGPDRVVAIELSAVVEDSDIKDEAGSPMFAEAVKKYGAPQRDECFGFVPALGLGGARRMEYVRRVRAPEHFAIISGLNPFRLVKFENMEKSTVRTIGN